MDELTLCGSIRLAFYCHFFDEIKSDLEGKECEI